MLWRDLELVKMSEPFKSLNFLKKNPVNGRESKYYCPVKSMLSFCGLGSLLDCLFRLPMQFLNLLFGVKTEQHFSGLIQRARILQRQPESGENFRARVRA